MLDYKRDKELTLTRAAAVIDTAAARVRIRILRKNNTIFEF
jgi:hypothetical protein